MIDKSALKEQTQMSPYEIEYVVETLNELQEKMSDWMETPVEVSLWKTEEEALVDPEDCLDEYVVIMKVNDRELVSFTDEEASTLADTLSVWAIRHLIISCGSHNTKFELPEPALA